MTDQPSWRTYHVRCTYAKADDSWHVARYDDKGYASEHLCFASVLEAQAYRQWLVPRGNSRTSWLKHGKGLWRASMVKAVAKHQVVA